MLQSAQFSDETIRLTDFVALKRATNISESAIFSNQGIQALY